MKYKKGVAAMPLPFLFTQDTKKAGSEEPAFL
jgi:hypothetical protein